MPRRLLLLIFLVSSIAGYATHIRGGQIRVVSSNGLTCSIEMRLLTNTGSEIKAGEGLFDFGDGTSVTTETKNHVLVPGQPGVGLVVYNFVHTYPAYGTYILSYLEPNLNGGILNVPNSVETRFFIKSQIILSPNHSGSSPNFQTDPIFTCPAGRTYSFSTAAIDDSTSNNFFYKYSLVPPEKDKGAVILGYSVPGNLAINNENGIVTWDTKWQGEYTAGMFWIVVKVEKYSSTWQFEGYVLRALQIIVEDSDSKIGLTSSVADADNKVVVPDGQERKVKVILSDNSSVSNLNFDLYYNTILKNNISMTQYDSIAVDRKLRVAVLTLKTTLQVLSDLPYPITLRGRASYRTDITFLYMTKNGDLPDLPVGLPDENTVTVYPNPFHSEVYVDGTTSSEATFINSLGQPVMKSPVQQGQPVNTTSLPAGFYLLKITHPDGVVRKFKLIRDR
jgi:hypothetical protein